MSQPFATEEMIRADLPQHTALDSSVIVSKLAGVHSRIELATGGTFEGGPRTVRLDGEDDEALMLPLPGAESVSSVVEAGVTLTVGTDYEEDADGGYFLLRLTENNIPRSWPEGRRNIVVTFVPNSAPGWLVAIEVEETVKAILGSLAGYSGQIGVDSAGNAIRYDHSFSPANNRAIEDYKARGRRSMGMGGF